MISIFRVLSVVEVEACLREADESMLAKKMATSGVLPWRRVERFSVKRYLSKAALVGSWKPIVIGVLGSIWATSSHSSIEK
jgi:hypothetical protein